MKILLASTSSGSHGGGELCLPILATALRDRGHEPSLWCSTSPRMDGLADRFAAIGKVHRSEYPNTYYDRRSRSLGAFFDRTIPRRVSEHWRSLAPDVIHLNKQNLEDGLDLVSAARLAGLPAVCMIHITQPAQWLGAKFGRLRDAAAASRLRRFPGPLVTTPETRATSLRAIVGSSSDIRVIDNGVPPPHSARRSASRAQLGIPESSPLVIDVARLEPQKNPFKFLDIATAAINSGSEAHFLWVGSGSLQDNWLDLVRTRSLQSRIHHIPWTDEPAAWLAAADAFLHTADFEGMPFAVLEALASSLPVILPQPLIDEIPPFAAEGIIPLDSKLEWLALVSDAATRSSMADAAHQLYQRKFSADRMAEQYERLYLEVIARRHQH